MKRIIYTGNFSSRWGYFHGVQPWHIRSMYYQLAYAEKHGADYRVIDNSNQLMQDIYALYRTVSNEDADSWTLGTLVTYAAIEEFANSDYDQMAWIDLDVFIKKPHINIFDYYTPNTLHLYHYDPEKYYWNGLSQRFFAQKMLVEHKNYIQAGFIMLDRQIAYDILNSMKGIGINLLDENFARSLCDIYKSREDSEIGREMPVKFMCDECLLGACISNADIPLEYPPNELYSYITDGSNYVRDTDCFSVHFTAGAKYLINELF